MVSLAIVGALIGFGMAGVSAVAAGATWAWQASGLSKSRRRASRSVKPIAKEARKVDKTLARWREQVEPEAKAYAKARIDSRLRSLPVESLRDAGASNVRWSALHEAGLRTLHDVMSLSVRELAAVNGIGKTTAPRVAAAAKEMASRIRQESAEYPDPSLEQPHAVELAEKTLDLLEAGEAGGDAPRRVSDMSREFEQRLEGVRRESTFGRWATSPWNKERTESAIAHADHLATEADAAQQSGLLEESQAGRKRIKKWRRPTRDREGILKKFKDRYAECCSVLERMFENLGLRRRKTVSVGQGGLSNEVARRVEAFPLRSGAMKATLRRYQEFGAKYILAQERTILGDEMGLGKTMQALTAMTHCHDKDPGSRFFVVAPAGLLINWSREIEKFTPLKPWLIHGEVAAEHLESWIRDGGVAITSYATLRNLDLGEGLQQNGATVEFTAVDEAHFIKNPEAGRTQAVRRLLEQSARTCLMSGTPMENHPSEFLNLIEAIRPADAEDLRRKDLHLDAAAGSVRAFHRSVAKVYLRRNQEDVLSELPDKIEVEEWVELSREERRSYLEKVADSNFMGMRQAATLCPATGVSAKLDHLEELLEDHRESGRKVIIFSFFLGVLAALEKRFGAVGVISGKVSPQDKQALCDEFQAQEGHAILLLQINAGGQGLNLQKASAVVLMEPQTKPSIEAQAVARAHRMGQTNRVIVHRLLARNTCDQTLMAILAEKQDLFDAYARKSLVKEASGQATETSLAQAVIEAEKQRLADEQDASAGAAVEDSESAQEGTREEAAPENSASAAESIGDSPGKNAAVDESEDAEDKGEGGIGRGASGP